jgi:hypothetical protein
MNQRTITTLLFIALLILFYVIGWNHGMIVDNLKRVEMLEKRANIQSDTLGDVLNRLDKLQR